VDGDKWTELALQAGRGEEGALDRLVAGWEKATLRKVRLKVPYDEADDVVQEVWLRLCRSIGGFKGQSSFATWFDRVINNSIAQYYRERETRTRNAGVYFERISHEDTVDFESDLELGNLLSSIPAAYSQVLRDRFLGGLSISECANLQGLEYEAMRSNYRRSLAWCRAHRERLGLSQGR